jgi:hypothetical protein
LAQDQLIGQRVRLDGTEGPFRRCAYCGSVYAVVGAGHGPHRASLVCTQCTRHVSWLSQAHLDALAASQVKKGAA